jgi:hypothetical protein
MGPPLSERAPLPAEFERLAAVEAKKAAKDERKAANGRWINVQRMAQRNREQAIAEKAAVTEALNHWVEERKELVKKARVLREAKMQTRESLQGTRAANEQRRLANIAKMEALQKEKLARLERQLDRLEKTIQDPETPPEVKARLDKRRPWLLSALEKCEANAASKAEGNTSVDAAPSASPRSNTKELPVSLEALIGKIQERISNTKAEILRLEKGLLQSNEDDSVSAVAANQTVNSIQRAHGQKIEITKSLEKREHRIRTYLQTVKGKEQEYASLALKWQVLVDELHLNTEEKKLAISALATLTNVTFGSHVRKWSPEQIEADSARRRAMLEAQKANDPDMLSDTKPVNGDAQAIEQRNRSEQATTKEESKEGKQEAAGGWFKW